jgi:hypothetical protein
MGADPRREGAGSWRHPRRGASAAAAERKLVARAVLHSLTPRTRPLASRYKIAIGLTGDPVATASRSGAITHRNDQCLNSAHNGARTAKSR